MRELDMDEVRLRQLLNSFYKVTGLRVGIYDRMGSERMACPRRAQPFCDMVRCHARGLAACRECDARAVERACLSRQPQVYACHAGLSEAVVPIMQADECIAYLMLGQARSDAAGDVRAELKRRCAYVDDLDALERAYLRIPQYPAEYIGACALMLGACASYIRSNALVDELGESLPARFMALVRSAYTDELTLDEMARRLHVGRTTLCRQVTRQYGMGPHALLTQYRLESACHLLANSACPIGQVAARVGIADVNYFCKLFRREFALTPGQYRRQFGQLARS